MSFADHLLRALKKQRNLVHAASALEAVQAVIFAVEESIAAQRTEQSAPPATSLGDIPRLCPRCNANWISGDEECDCGVEEVSRHAGADLPTGSTDQPAPEASIAPASEAGAGDAQCGHTPLYVTDSTMRTTRLPCLFCERDALSSRGEGFEKSLSAWEQVWDNVHEHTPDLRADNKPLAVAATYELLRSRCEALEDGLGHIIARYDGFTSAKEMYQWATEALKKTKSGWHRIADEPVPEDGRKKRYGHYRDADEWVYSDHRNTTYDTHWCYWELPHWLTQGPEQP